MTATADESGFTLVELLIAVAVMGLIMVALGAGFSVGLRTMNDTSSRLAGSNDAQLVGVHLPPDIESATEAVGYPGNGTCFGADPVLRLTDGATFDVVYGVKADGATFRLDRYDCSGTTVLSTRIVARNLASATAVAPTRYPTSGTLTGAALTITEKATGTDATPYVFTVRGNRRSS